MAVLSNNGRLIISLPVASVLEGTDQFIIQSVSDVNPNGVTRRVNYDFIRQDLSDLVISDIQTDPTLKLSGSFYTPNGGYANFYTTQIRNGLTVSNGSLIISAGNLTVSSGNTSLQNTTATKFTGPLTGSVTGNLTGNVKSSGTSTFVNISATSLTVNGSMTCFATAALYTVQINGGTINGTQIGQTTPSLLTGTRLTGSIGIKSLGKMFVDNDLSVVGTSYLPYITGSNMTASKITSGKIVGNLTGDIFSPTGNKVLENGAGLAKNSRFYGTSSYAGSSSYAVTASYAFAVVPVNFVKFSLSSSYASASNVALTALTSSWSINSVKSIFGFSSSYASASRSSSYALTSSWAFDSIKSRFGFSASYASASRSSSYARTSSVAITSKSTSTASYVLQNNTDYTNKLAYYDGTAITSVNDLTPQFNYPYRFLYFSGSPDLSNPSLVPINNYIVVDGYNSSLAGPSSGQSALALSLNINRAYRNSNALEFAYNYGPEAWNLMTFDSGSFVIQSYKQSYAYSSSLYYIKSRVNSITEATFNVAKIVNNSVYFWGEPVSYNTAMRDGAIGIGVPAHSITTGQSKLKARLQIDVFSSSIANLGTGAWTGTAPVRELPAILVRYGSGSITTPLEKTFYVSGSGNTYVGGILSCSNDVYVAGDLDVKGQIRADGYAKAWVNFGWGYGAGPLVVSSSYNVASVTRNGTPGDYTITFSSPTPFSSVNYLMIGTATLPGYPGAAGVAYHTAGSYRKVTQKTTSAVRVVIVDNSTEGQFDPIQANIVFFGF